MIFEKWRLSFYLFWSMSRHKPRGRYKYSGAGVHMLAKVLLVQCVSLFLMVRVVVEVEECIHDVVVLKNTVLVCSAVLRLICSRS